MVGVMVKDARSPPLYTPRRRTVTPNNQALSRLTAALAMGARGTDDPLARLRFAYGALVAIQVDEFPEHLRGSWETIRGTHTRFGPHFERLPPERARGLVQALYGLVGKMEYGS